MGTSYSFHKGNSLDGTDVQHSVSCRVVSCLQLIWAMLPLLHVIKKRDDITYFVLTWWLHLGINSPWPSQTPIYLTCTVTESKTFGILIRHSLSCLFITFMARNKNGWALSSRLHKYPSFWWCVYFIKKRRRYSAVYTCMDDVLWHETACSLAAHMCDFRLPPQCRWDLRSSGILRSACW
jgi:hypothetical protein